MKLCGRPCGSWDPGPKEKSEATESASRSSGFLPLRTAMSTTRRSSQGDDHPEFLRHGEGLLGVLRTPIWLCEAVIWTQAETRRPQEGRGQGRDMCTVAKEILQYLCAK